MKRSKLCYGVLSALAIIFGWSLNVSSDTSALSYQVDKIPLMIPSASNSFPNNLLYPPAMTVEVSGDYYASQHLYDQPQLSQYLLFLSGDSEGCSATAFKHLPIPSSNSSGTINTFSYSFYGYNPNWPYFSKIRNTSSNPCSSTSPPPISTSSISSLSTDPFVTSQLLALRPYRYSYDGFFLKDTYNEDGLNYNTKFDLLYNLFGSSANVPDRIYRVQIPLGAAEFDIPADTPLSVSGEFIFDFDDPSVSVLSSSTKLEFGISILQGGAGSTYYYTVPCSYHLKRDDPSDSTSPWSFTYICNSTVRSNGSNIYNPSTDIVIPYLIFTPAYLSDNINPFYQFIFDSTVVITNNDDTPASTAWSTTSISGSNPHLAPGSAYQNAISGQDPDYDTSLVDMFNFSFTNPFEPIFHLFSDSNQCASIPTIAGMIHSNETTVCPWFSSSVRSIATPVLGLASMMLVFGFSVRWLGSSSGNLFEDSRHEEVSNQGGRWGHFKKGGR